MPRLRRLAELLAAVLVATMLGTAISAAQPDFDIFEGADIPGGDYLMIRQSGLPECFRSCAGDGKCRAFTFNAHKNVCFLKDGGGSPKHFVGAISGRKKEIAAQSSAGFDILNDSDLPGGDFDMIRDIGLAQCQQACAADRRCTGFTQNVGKNVCFLKSGNLAPQHFAGAVSGKKSPTNTAAAALRPTDGMQDGFLMYRDTDLPGGDGSLIAQKPGSMEACRLECLFEDRCQAFTYNHNADVCFGKGPGFIGWDRAWPTPFKGATSGRKASPVEVREARKRYQQESPKVPVADLAWRTGDTAQTFVRRIRAAAQPMGGPCDTERVVMDRIAASVQATLSSQEAVAGTAIVLEWKAAPQEKAPPIWLMVSVNGPTRFVAPGFYALTAGAIAPFGIEADSSRTRAMTTLFGQGALDHGLMEIVPLRAGALEVSVRAVGYLRACEEEYSAEISASTVTVSPSPVPTFQVRDPFSFERPSKVWLSPDGDTRLEVFDGRFRIVDMESGAFIADRQGRYPNYSPTGRFVSVLSGESGYDIIDTIDGAIVRTTRPSVLGWENEDSIMVEGWSGVGGVSAHSLLVADAEVGGQPSCRICPGRDESYILDLENDLVHDGDGKYAQRLSGSRASSGIPGTDARRTIRFVAEQTAAAPVHLPSGWTFRGGLKFAPYEPWVDTANDAEPSETQREELAHMFHAQELTDGRTVEVAGLQPIGIGEWRGAVRIERPRAVEDTVLVRLADLGLRFSQDRKPSFIDNDAQAESAAIAKRIGERIPAMKRVFVPAERRLSCGVHYDEPDSQNKLLADFHQAVEYRIGERTIWLTMFVCVDGSAAFYNSTFVLMDSTLKDGFMPLAARNPHSDIGTECHGDISYCEFASRLYDDRYLLIWSTASSAILLFDLDRHEPVFTEFALGRGDLFKEARYSAETRHITQINTDGSFYVYDVTTAERVLEGRYVDDETIAWAPDLRFDASPEGANYVNLRFPGQKGQYAFQQFAARVKRPGLVQDVFERRYTPVSQSLALPPRLTGSMEDAGERIVGEARPLGAVELRIYQDGLLTDTIPVSPDDSAVPIDVKRAPGARWAALVAHDADGLASLPLGRALPPVDGLLPTMHALTVGIDRYTGTGLQPLRYAKADAATLLAAIEAQQGRSLALGTTATLADEDATPDAILKQAEDMVAAAGIGETIVFSFAGHGVTGTDGRFYLATSGTSASDVAGTALAWDRLAAVLSRAQARVIVFLDACHSGAAGTALFATNDDAVGEVLDGVPSGLLIFSASKGRQFSEESASAGGGLFTNAVADVIARDRAAHDLDGNGAIEISELYVGVKRKVAELSAGRQVPWLARNEMVGDFSIF